MVGFGFPSIFLSALLRDGYPIAKSVPECNFSREAFCPTFFETSHWHYYTKDWTIKQVSRSLEVSPKTVWNTLKRFREKGVVGLYDGSRIPKRLSTSQILTLRRMKYPQYPRIFQEDLNWSYPKLAKWVEENWHITITPQRISQLVRQETFGH